MRGRAFAYANIIQFAAIPVVAFLGWLLVPRTVFGPGRLALCGDGGIGGRGAGLVRARAIAGKPALAGAAMAAARKRTPSSKPGKWKQGWKGAKLAAEPKAAAGGAGQGIVRGNLDARPIWAAP